MTALDATVHGTTQAPDGTVRGLAWKLLYGNHRPTLGPEAWRRLVDEAGGPDDVKALGVDEPVDEAAYARGLRALDDALDEHGGLEQVGVAFVERWSTMYQRLAEHLDGRPERMLDLAVREVVPWFFEDADTAVEATGEAALEVRVDAGLPEAFVAGLLRGFPRVVGAEATVEALGERRYRIAWTPADATAPSTARLVWQATRARMLPATVAPVLVGGALAAQQGAVDGLAFGLALAGAVCLHLAFNLLNDVVDHRRGVDEANLTPTPFSGGSRVLQRGLMGSDAMLSLAAGLAAAGAALGGVLVLGAGPGTLVLAALGVGLGYAYSGEPWRLADRGLGEAAAGLVFGPLIAAGAHAVQAGGVTPAGLAAGVPLGASFAAVLMVNELPDAPWDARTGRRTLAVRLGEHGGLGAGLALLTPYPLLGALVLADLLPVGALVGLGTLPLALFLGHRVRVAGRDADAIAPLQGPVLGLHATLGALTAAGIAAEVLF